MKKSPLSGKIAAVGIAAAAFGAPAVIFADEKEMEPQPVLEEDQTGSDLTSTDPVLNTEDAAPAPQSEELAFSSPAAGIGSVTAVQNETATAAEEASGQDTAAAAAAEKGQKTDPAKDPVSTDTGTEQDPTASYAEEEAGNEEKTDSQTDSQQASDPSAADQTEKSDAGDKLTADAENPAADSVNTAAKMPALPAENANEVSIDTNSLTWQQFSNYISGTDPATLIFSAGEAQLNNPWVGIPANQMVISNKTFVADGDVVLNFKNYRYIVFENCIFKGLNPEYIDTDRRDSFTFIRGNANVHNPSARELGEFTTTGNTTLENISFKSYMEIGHGTTQINGHVYFTGGYNNTVDNSAKTSVTFSRRVIKKGTSTFEDTLVEGVSEDSRIIALNGIFAAEYNYGDATYKPGIVKFSNLTIDANALTETIFKTTSFATAVASSEFDNCTIITCNNKKGTGFSIGSSIGTLPVGVPTCVMNNCVLTASDNSEYGLVIGRYCTLNATNTTITTNNNGKSGIIGSGDNVYAINARLIGTNVRITANNNGSVRKPTDFVSACGIATVAFDLSGDNPDMMIIEANGNTSYGIEIRGSAGTYEKIDSKISSIRGYKIQCNDNKMAGMLVCMNNTDGYLIFDQCDVELLNNGSEIDKNYPYSNAGIKVMPYNVTGDVKLVIQDSDVNIAGSPYGISVSKNGSNAAAVVIKNTDDQNKTKMNISGTVCDIFINQDAPRKTSFVIEGGNIVASSPITFDQYMSTNEHYSSKVVGYPTNQYGQRLYRFDFTGTANQAGFIEYLDNNGNMAKAPFVYDENGKASVWLPVGVMIFDGNGGKIDGKDKTGFIAINGQTGKEVNGTEPAADQVIRGGYNFRFFSPEYNADQPITGEVVSKAQWQLINDWTTEPSMKDWTYGSLFPSTPKGAAKAGTVVFTYSTSEDGPFTSERPANAGTYYLKAEVAGTEDYTGLSKVISFTISKAKNRLNKAPAIEDWTYTGDPDSAKPTAGTALSKTPVRFVYSDTEDGEYTETVPLNAGTYYMKAVVDESQNYLAYESKPVQFHILQADNEWTVDPSVENWTYSSDPSVPEAEAKFGTPEFTYSESENGPFTSEVPANAGTCYMKAIVPETENYKGLEAVVEFKIDPKKLDDSNTTVGKVDDTVDVTKVPVQTGQTVLGYGTDYTVTEEKDGNKVTVTFTFHGNYIGEITRTYILSEKPETKPNETQKPEVKPAGYVSQPATGRQETAAVKNEVPATSAATHSGFFAAMASISAAAAALFLGKRKK